MSRKIKMGVFGAGRGQTMVGVLARHPDAELVAICDGAESRLQACARLADEAGAKITTYTRFDDFLSHEMDAVILANYATEHAPFAVRLLDSGRHVCSEVLACQNLAEAVALAEAAERSGRVYTYAENYCYFRGTLEMRRLYQRGDLGEFLHGEGEYVHDCESLWPQITYGEKNHWRNWMPSTFYCTHAIGPVMTITGTRPVRLTAYETPNVNKRHFGCRSADGAVIVCQMSNGATARFLPCPMFKREPGSVWYCIYGSKGMAETDRWNDGVNRVYVYLDEKKEMETYQPEFPQATELSRQVAAHGGSDFFTMQHFLDAILDRPGKELAIDVHQALDMTLPGTLGYRSILEGNIPLEVPDLRDPATRERYRHDRWCLDPRLADEPGQPRDSCSSGPVEVSDDVYAAQARAYEQMMNTNVS